MQRRFNRMCSDASCDAILHLQTCRRAQVT
jgi:hypothetical protein